MRKNKTGLIVGVVLGVIALGAGAYWYLGNRENEVASTETSVLQTMTPTNGNVMVSVTLPAVMEPFRSTSLRSATAGRIISLAPVGTTLQAGQPILALDPTEARQNLRQAEIQAAEAEINQEKAQGALTRAQKTLADAEALLRAGGTSNEQVQAARDGLVAADQTLRLSVLTRERADLGLQAARLALENTTIRAPFGGTLLSLELGEGDLVTTNGLVGVFADLSRVRLVGEIDEFDAVRIASGMTVQVKTEGPNAQTVNAVLETISPSAEIINNISVFKASAVVPNTEGTLRPGMTADLAVIIAQDRGLVVPSNTVSTVRSRSYIDVLVDGVPETKRIEIGANDGKNVVVLEGLEATDQVVLPATAALPGFLPTSAPAAASGTSIIPVSVPGANTR